MYNKSIEIPVIYEKNNGVYDTRKWEVPKRNEVRKAETKKQKKRKQKDD